MLGVLKDIDYWLFELINQKLSANWLDGPMEILSNKFVWIPFYALLLFLIIRTFKAKSCLYIIALIATVASTDLISSKVFKPGVKRTRPCNIEELNPRLPIGQSHSYGFVSSHAANHTAIAVFIILVFSLSGYKKYGLIIWAVAISYSRVYLGKHFFFDVFAGALLGVLLALFWIKILNLIQKKLN